MTSILNTCDLEKANRSCFTRQPGLPSLLHIKLVGVDHLNLMTASFHLFTLLPDPVVCTQAIPPGRLFHLLDEY